MKIRTTKNTESEKEGILIKLWHESKNDIAEFIKKIEAYQSKFDTNRAIDLRMFVPVLETQLRELCKTINLINAKKKETEKYPHTQPLPHIFFKKEQQVLGQLKFFSNSILSLKKAGKIKINCLRLLEASLSVWKECPDKEKVEVLFNLASAVAIDGDPSFSFFKDALIYSDALTYSEKSRENNIYSNCAFMFVFFEDLKKEGVNKHINAIVDQGIKTRIKIFAHSIEKYLTPLIEKINLSKTSGKKLTGEVCSLIKTLREMLGYSVWSRSAYEHTSSNLRKFDLEFGSNGKIPSHIKKNFSSENFDKIFDKLKEVISALRKFQFSLLSDGELKEKIKQEIRENSFHNYCKIDETRDVFFNGMLTQVSKLSHQEAIEIIKLSLQEKYSISSVTMVIERFYEINKEGIDLTSLGALLAQAMDFAFSHLNNKNKKNISLASGVSKKELSDTFINFMKKTKSFLNEKIKKLNISDLNEVEKKWYQIELTTKSNLLLIWILIINHYELQKSVSHEVNVEEPLVSKESTVSNNDKSKEKKDGSKPLNDTMTKNQQNNKKPDSGILESTEKTQYKKNSIFYENKEEYHRDTLFSKRHKEESSTEARDKTNKKNRKGNFKKKSDIDLSQCDDYLGSNDFL